MLAEKKGRSTAYDYRVPFLTYPCGDLFHPRHHAIGIKRLIREMRSAFVAAAPKGFREAVEWAIHALVAALNGGLIDIGQPRNLFRQAPVPQVPSQLPGELGGDGAGSAAVLPFDRDHPEHRLS